MRGNPHERANDTQFGDPRAQVYLNGNERSKEFLVLLGDQDGRSAQFTGSVSVLDRGPNQTCKQSIICQGC